MVSECVVIHHKYSRTSAKEDHVNDAQCSGKLVGKAVLLNSYALVPKLVAVRCGHATAFFDCIYISQAAAAPG
jgi:hypothetical protein